MLKPAQRAEQLPTLFFAELNKQIAQLKATGANIIRLDAGSPDMPPHETIRNALKQTTDDTTQHGYGGYAGQPYLRDAIIKYYQRRFKVTLEADELQPLLGSKEGLANMHLAWLDPGDLALIPNPGYAAYQTAPLLANGRVETFPLLPERNWLPDFSAIPEKSARDARLIWLNYPNNPTGAMATLEFFTEAVEFCRQYEILLCHDAPYSDVTYDGYRALSLLEVPNAKEVVIEFNSFSKTYNMAGWRVGMAVGNRIAVQALAKIKNQVDSGLAKPIQKMATEALLGDQRWITERNVIYQRRRDLCLNSLAEIGLTAFRPQGAMYVWFKAPSGYSSVAFQQQILKEAHVSIVPGSIYGSQGEGWMRISLVVDIETLETALARLKKFVA